MTNVTYTHNKAYTGLRPYADVFLLGPIGRANFKALVDTGADYLQLPATAASTVGLPLVAGLAITATTAGGITTMTKMAGVSVEIEGKAVVVDILFNPDPTSSPLLGRQALLATLEPGFNTVEWLWRF